MRSQRRAIVHYLVALTILSIYGSHVCPFVDSLTPAQQILPLVALLLVQFAARPAVRRRLVDTAPAATQAGRVLAVETGLFLASGTALTVFNALTHHFPVTSGLKLMLGFFTLGFFAGIDLALEHERDLVRRVRETGRPLPPGDRAAMPLARRLGLFASICLLMTVGVLFLVVVKDLDWLKEVGGTVAPVKAHWTVLGEFGFVMAVIAGHVLNVIHSYAGNLGALFDGQERVMAEAAEGRLDGWVPAAGNDEFGRMADHTNAMIRRIRERTEALARTQDVAIVALASLAETRDNETGAHILRTQRYVRALAEHLAGHPRYCDRLDAPAIDLLFKSAPLHDVGKVGVPDAILLKPGRLSDDEFRTMKTHAALGGQALRVAEARLGSNSFLQLAREIAESHHEKWDGSGYPLGLAGEAIPLSGRLMAVADVYDALISKRVYKPAFPHEEAMRIIVEGRGAHFDPDVVDALLAIEDRFRTIAAAFRDESQDDAPEAAPRQAVAAC